MEDIGGVLCRESNIWALWGRTSTSKEEVSLSPPPLLQRRLAGGSGGDSKSAGAE